MMQKVLLGMSGGTDSSVSAMMLLEQGFEVIGITFDFWESPASEMHMRDAEMLARELGIRHLIYNARELFKRDVLEYFKDEYLDGKTPFPCAKCNRDVKWKLLFEMADQLGCDFVSTGHYSRIVELDGNYFISQGIDTDKDQSFFLWPLQQEQLKRIIFPLGDMKKDDVRKYANDKGFLKISAKKDSLGACFCDGDYRPLLKSLVEHPEKYFYTGNFVDENGKILGTHDGFPNFTVGQRRGLGIHLNKAVFVKEIRVAQNEVVLAPLQSMYKSVIFLRDFRLVNRDLFSEKFDVITKIRYRKQENVSRLVFVTDEMIKIELLEPLESVAPGQTAVFYRDGKVLGGGFIEFSTK